MRYRGGFIPCDGACMTVSLASYEGLSAEEALSRLREDTRRRVDVVEGSAAYGFECAEAASLQFERRIAAAFRAAPAEAVVAAERVAAERVAATIAGVAGIARVVFDGLRLRGGLDIGLGLGVRVVVVGGGLLDVIVPVICGGGLRFGLGCRCCRAG